MKLNVTDIQSDIGLEQSIEGELLLEDTTWQGEDVIFKEPFQIKGSIANNGDGLTLKTAVHGTVVLTCGLCMAKFDHILDFSFEARLKKTVEEEDPDFFIYQGYEIDISDIVLEFIFLEMPSKRQCLEDCKGLCPDCGTNLNVKSCKCNTEENDPDLGFDERLKALKDYFPTQGKEV